MWLHENVCSWYQYKKANMLILGSEILLQGSLLECEGKRAQSQVFIRFKILTFISSSFAVFGISSVFEAILVKLAHSDKLLPKHTWKVNQTQTSQAARKHNRPHITEVSSHIFLDIFLLQTFLWPIVKRWRNDYTRIKYKIPSQTLQELFHWWIPSISNSIWSIEP